MLRFVTADVGTIRGKRKQARRACEKCRKRKKRCDHLGAMEEKNTSPSGSISSVQSNSESAQETSRVTRSVHRSLPDLQDVSDQNKNQAVGNWRHSDDAVARLNEDEDSNAGRDTERRLSGSHGSRFIGDLNPEGILLAEMSPESTRGMPLDDSIGVWLADKFKKKVAYLASTGAAQKERTSFFYGFGTMAQKIFVPMLEEHCLSLLPPPPDCDTLISFYFDNIHPIFPFINRDKFGKISRNDPAGILLRQGICLVASMNFPMQRNLRLSAGEALMGHKEFGKRISTAMRLAIEIGLVTDKIVHIQALALMSFFMDGPEGRDVSSLTCTRAIQSVFTLGIHLKDAQRESEYKVTLLCCIWALDRLNAAFHGRPVTMHERDIRPDFKSCFDRQTTCFQLFLRVMLLLDEVIQLYRPRVESNEGEEDDALPAYEELLLRCNASHLTTSFIATIETLYHAVAILSCRSRPGRATQPSSAAYLRQSLSAIRVTSMVGHEHRDHLILLPFVPYAVSLSLSIAYREMRRNKVPMFRARARSELQANCRVLQDLGEIFWWASKMADVGSSMLDQLDRAYSNVASSERRRKQQEVIAIGMNGTRDGGLRESAPSQENTEALGMNPPLINSDVNDSNRQIQDFDPSMFTDLPDLDLFDAFDTNFDLNGIDAFLEGNLDLSSPTALQ